MLRNSQLAKKVSATAYELLLTVLGEFWVRLKPLLATPFVTPKPALLARCCRRWSRSARPISGSPSSRSARAAPQCGRHCLQFLSVSGALLRGWAWVDVGTR